MDYAGNGLEPMIIDNAIKDGLGVSAFLLDMTSAETAYIKLELVGLSAISGQSFSKIDVTLLTVLSTAQNTTSSTSAPSSYSLTGSNGIQFSVDEEYMTIYLNSYDYNIIQSLFVLNSHSVVSVLVESGMLIDTNGKTMASTVTLPCSQLLLRQSLSSSSSSSGSLQLIYFNIDMIVGRLVLYFNRQIILSKVNLVDNIYLQNLPAPSNNSIGFTQVCYLF